MQSKILSRRDLEFVLYELHEMRGEWFWPITPA